LRRMGRSQPCNCSRWSLSTFCVSASAASAALNSAEVSRFALGRTNSLSRISAHCGGGVSSFLLYLEPCSGLSRTKAMRTWGDVDSGGWLGRWVGGSVGWYIAVCGLVDGRGWAVVGW
jgi:hypothetical protein